MQSHPYRALGSLEHYAFNRLIGKQLVNPSLGWSINSFFPLSALKALFSAPLFLHLPFSVIIVVMDKKWGGGQAKGISRDQLILTLLSTGWTQWKHSCWYYRGYGHHASLRVWLLPLQSRWNTGQTNLSSSLRGLLPFSAVLNHTLSH